MVGPRKEAYDLTQKIGGKRSFFYHQSIDSSASSPLFLYKTNQCQTKISQCTYMVKSALWKYDDDLVLSIWTNLNNGRLIVMVIVFHYCYYKRTSTLPLVGFGLLLFLLLFAELTTCYLAVPSVSFRLCLSYPIPMEL